MAFIDECVIRIEAGNGGNGAVAFRRERLVPFGGPAGGDGGRGGSVVLQATSNVSTLQEFQHQAVLKATNGAHGEGRDCYGRAGDDLIVRVPVGTMVFDDETGERLFDLVAADQREVIARGGKGGRGNKHFATPVDRAPRHAEPGEPGEHRRIRLELRVMADVGLLGFPNVGKSTLIRAVSRARPKVADYPFTTLEPQLGVVTVGDARRGLGRTFVVADIPGLIPGASEGHGLGTRFLRHLDRTRVILHLVTLTAEEGRDPVRDYQVLRRELRLFNPELARRPEVVALTKSDLPDVREAYDDVRQRFAELGVELRLVSAAAFSGTDDLMQELAEQLML